MIFLIVYLYLFIERYFTFFNIDFSSILIYRLQHSYFRIFTLPIHYFYQKLYLNLKYGQIFRVIYFTVGGGFLNHFNNYYVHKTCWVPATVHKLLVLQFMTNCRVRCEQNGCTNYICVPQGIRASVIRPNENSCHVLGTCNL